LGGRRKAVPRTLTIFFPNGAATEDWYTTLVFKAGDTFDRNGQTWVVTSVAPPPGTHDGDGKHTTITVRGFEDLPT
jgi:hypothetical protein